MDLLVTAESSAWLEWLAGIWSGVLNVLMVAVGLGVVIFVHELGHFLVAKWCGVKCEKFLVGFDVPIKIGPWKLPNTLWKKKWGETVYAVGIIPLGGYVKMLGQDDNPANAAKEAERTRIRAGSVSDGTETQGVSEGTEGGDGEADLDAASPADKEPSEETFELDPRSYPAKTVPQRMAIISAGVIMNLIFAVVFATIAFGIGVNYTPTIIGGTTAGLPAWQQNLPLGKRVVGVGADAEPNPQMRFKMDFMQQVHLQAASGELTLMLQDEDGQIEHISIKPETIPYRRHELALIGVSPMGTNTFAKKRTVVPGTAADTVADQLEGGDTIVAVKADGETFPVANSLDRDRLFIQHRNGPITLVLRRGELDGDIKPGSAEDDRPTVDATIPANPLCDFGLAVRMGPIKAVQLDSPAAGAGLTPGDWITAVDGVSLTEPVEIDGHAVTLGPMTLPYYLMNQAGKPVQVTVLREEKKRTITLTPRTPATTAMPNEYQDVLAADAIGVAYYITDEVATVVPGGPADKAGVKPGDTILKAEFIAASKENERRETHLGRQELDVAGLAAWFHVIARAEASFSDTKVRLTVKRGDEEKELTLTPQDSPVFFSEKRGIRLTTHEELLVADNPWHAFTLGVRNTWESLSHVFNFLGQLVTGRLSLTKLGGPLTIFAVAGSEASVGVTSLLLFLTLLSANLAIINFLPIPVLDGGHMMFLIYEGIRGKPADENWVMGLTFAGLIFILGLMALAISMDIYRLTG